MTNSGFLKLLLPLRFSVFFQPMNICVFHQWINCGIKGEDDLSAKLVDPKLWQCSVHRLQGT